MVHSRRTHFITIVALFLYGVPCVFAQPNPTSADDVRTTLKGLFQHEQQYLHHNSATGGAANEASAGGSEIDHGVCVVLNETDTACHGRVGVVCRSSGLLIPGKCGNSRNKEKLEQKNDKALEAKCKKSAEPLVCQLAEAHSQNHTIVCATEEMVADRADFTCVNTKRRGKSFYKFTGNPIYCQSACTKFDQSIIIDSGSGGQ